MAFHEFPKTCDETIKNTLKNNWTLANSWDGTYNWNLLKSSSYGENLSAEGKMMLGALMYENAEGLKADYSTTGTNIKYVDHVPFLKKKGFSCDSLANYSYNKIKKSIDNNYPVLIMGNSLKKMKNHKFLWWTWETLDKYDGGHIWVVDGYCNMQCTAKNKNNQNDTKTFTTNYVHCNLGWGGSKNGYYMDKVFSANIGANASDETVENITRTTYGTERYYQYYLKIVTNIRPKN